jgi:hypothetical protein
MELERQQRDPDEANAQALRGQQAREARDQEQAAERRRTLNTGIENRTLIEAQVAAVEARKQELLLSPLPEGIEALKSRAATLTALDQIIVSALAKRPLSATEEQAERTLAEERRTQETRIRELQRKDPPLIGGTTQSKFVHWFLILENEFVSRELEDSDRRTRWAANGLKKETSLYAAVSEQLRSSKDAGQPYLWTEFKTFVQNHIRDPIIRRFEAAHSYHNAQQRPGQTFDSFLAYVRLIEGQLEHRPWANDEQWKIEFFFSRCLDDIRQELLRSQSTELGKLETAEHLFSKIRFVEQILKIQKRKSTDGKSASTRGGSASNSKRKRRDSEGKGTQIGNSGGNPQRGSANNSSSGGGNNSNASSSRSNRGGRGGNQSGREVRRR